jgi:F-type H+-transporting ATPase subunit delta
MSEVADIKVAKRYGTALFNAARQTGRAEAVLADLKTLSDLWTQSPELRESLLSPLVPAEKKHAIVDQIFGQSLDTVTVQFLHVLVEKSREGIIRPVQREFARMYDEALGMVRAHATVAAPLDDAQRATLVQSLQTRTGKQVELDVVVDPVILGGVVVRIGDTVIDGSVRGSLERLRERMLAEA